ncbi:MAG: hypothetical protein KC502_09215 [Myxococcales bacterium]|nr:hypothetical protein [Myxococcales bacterium]
MNKEKEAIGALLDTYLGGGGDLFDPRPSASDDRLGKSVTVSGQADSSASGPILVAGDETFLLTDLGSWPAEIVGKTVEVTGTVGSTSAGDDPLVNAAGEYSHGATGTSATLRGATWTVKG